MAGRGELGPEDAEVHPQVLALDQALRWAPAVDPIHFDKPIAAVGPGVTFGKIMAEREPAIRVGLIPCAAGGSPIQTWQPGAYWAQTGSHPYDDAIARTRAAMADGVLVGMLWHQGESDCNAEDAPRYEERLAALIHALRADLDAPHAPFVAATLADFYPARPEGVGEGDPALEAWRAHAAQAAIVNGALRRIPGRVARAACVESGDLAHKGDGVHFDGASARELGRRYARAMIGLLEG
ncbi:MAG: sialate O-acetylesterase [Anaerolineae bacterium]|nr:sialate O-acetylesterase [Anaerolineae bacterium]